jgi:CBS domain-containing protein
MLATVLADLVFSAVSEDSLMTEKLRRRGLRIGRHYGVDPFASANVRQLMTESVQTLPADATVGAARTRFVAGGHGAYPIVDGDGKVVGIITRGDVLREDEHQTDDEAPLLEHATTEVVTVAVDDSALAVLTAMVDEHVEHVPVVDGDRRLVGICTRTDLLKVRRRQQALERRDPLRFRRS